LFVAALGEAGKHARVAVGCNELPIDAPVEVAVWAEVSD
ncbi:MAG TPA: RidA family protein, partial [Planctomycetia bacterium]|nr:RidA family protein [Planctomycetia bacterium]